MGENKYYEIKLKKIINETETIKTYLFDKPDFDWSEGTNIHVAFRDFKDHEKKKFVRHFSIMNVDDQSYLAFTTRVTASPFKHRLNTLKIGDTLLAYKPSQRMKMRSEDRPLVLCSMGVGLAAIKPILETYLKHPKGIESVKSIHISNKERLYDEYFKSSNFDHTCTHSRHDYYQLLKETYSKKNIYYIVGSEDYIIQNMAILFDLGHTLEDIEIDKKADKKEKYASKAYKYSKYL